jgi:drug/metabolite transporter (DMT)-like permease
VSDHLIQVLEDTPDPGVDALRRSRLPERAIRLDTAERRRRAGVVACLVSAAGFGALPILGKAAFEVGVGPLGLLWTRFGLAALVFWGVVAVVRPARPATRWLLAGLLMGFAGYAVEAALFFLALERIDASLTELLLYAYPAMVTAAAVARGRERLSGRLAGALILASGGLVAVLAGSLALGANLAGFALGLSAAAVYAGYVLAGERVVAVVPPLLLAALVSTGAAAAFTLAGLAGAPLHLPATGPAWGLLGLIAVVGTVVPMVALFVGIERVGAPTASILSTAEPVVTVALAMLLLGEALSPVEALGALAVLAAVRLLQTPPVTVALPTGGEEGDPVSSGREDGGPAAAGDEPEMACA